MQQPVKESFSCLLPKTFPDLQVKTLALPLSTGCPANPASP
jgi:hypothetical protein